MKATPEKIDVVCSELSNLLVEKQEAYGDSVGISADLMKIFYPDGIKPQQYRDSIFVIRILDKISRITRGDNTKFNEDARKDIAGYGILWVAQGAED
jgi:hypothetical protein